MFPHSSDIIAIKMAELSGLRGGAEENIAEDHSAEKPIIRGPQRRREHHRGAQSRGTKRGGAKRRGAKRIIARRPMRCGKLICIFSFSIISHILYNAFKNPPFQRNGAFALQFVHYFLTKAKEAQKRGLNCSRGDFLWQGFADTYESIMEACINAHAGSNTEVSRREFTRNNY
jgi:hypothetical protein